MPRSIILLVCIAFICYLLRQDVKKSPNSSYALWVPCLWFAIYASRAISSWFGFGQADATSDYYLEGSPFDRNVFIALIVLGIIILIGRRVDWGAVLKNNKFIFLYILYLGISTLWSDFTDVSFKRWIKELGHLIMILIILTESSPVEAIRALITRCAYILIPLSWIFNRYFPEISRFYSVGGGDPQFTGITTNKNSLGVLCLISAMALFWSFLNWRKQEREKKTTTEFCIFIIFAILLTWLLYNARSATSIAGTIIGCGIIFLFTTQHVRKNVKFIGYYAIASIIVLIIIHLSFDIMSVVTSGLGRDETLTGRTEFWIELIAFGTDPFIGTGYESFWLGERIAFFWAKYWWHPNQAHNGYVEIYLNIGIIGLVLLVTFILTSLRNIKNNITNNRQYEFQIFRIAFIIVAIVINLTEAYFKGPVWFLFLLMAIEPPSHYISDAEMPTALIEIPPKNPL